MTTAGKRGPAYIRPCAITTKRGGGAHAIEAKPTARMGLRGDHWRSQSVIRRGATIGESARSVASRAADRGSPS